MRVLIFSQVKKYLYIVKKRRDYYANASLTELVRLGLNGTFPCALRRYESYAFYLR